MASPSWLSSAPQDDPACHVDEAYSKALEKKRIFKDYLARHKVVDNLNSAITQLFESPQLPEDPNQFIAACITSQQKRND
jgi:hypothetical protein